MIGSRGHFSYVLTGLDDRPDVELAGVSPGVEGDSVEGILAWCGKNGRTPEVVPDYRDMLDRFLPDVVCVDGPFERHAAMCIEAFGRGIHVFSEKPVATTLSDLAALRAAHAKAGVHFAGMMGLRYDPAFYAAWEQVRQGAVGDVRMVNARKSYKLGERPEFYRHRDSYGGTIPWVGSHGIDWILWYAGAQVTSVCARHSTVGNRGHGELEATAICQFELERDILATLSIDYLRPMAAPTHGDDRVRVVGTEGVIEVRDGGVFLIRRGGEGEQTIEPACDREIFRDFVSQIEGRGPGLVSADETFELTRICLLALQSADQGRIVSCRT